MQDSDHRPDDEFASDADSRNDMSPANSTNPPPDSPPSDEHHETHSHRAVLIGLILGIVFGLIVNQIGRRWLLADENANGIDDRIDLLITIAETIGIIFLRLVFMTVLPLVFSALALAVIEIGDVRQLGRLGLRTLVFAGILSLSAVVIGLTLVNTLRPGDALSDEQSQQLNEKYRSSAEMRVVQAEQAKSFRDTLVDIIPENPLQEMVGALDGSSKGNGMLAVMFFSLALGTAVTANRIRCHTFVLWLEGLYSIAMTLIGAAMKLAPLGAGCLVFGLTAQLGGDILTTLLRFVATTMLGLGLHLFVVYPIVISLWGGMSPAFFFRGASQAMLVAFGTSSSNVTLPTAIKVAQDELNIPKRIANFVLTVGATGNQNGTALYEGVVVLFLAQVFGVDLTFPQQITVVLMSVLAGIGTAGVPGGSLPLIVVLLQSVGVPGEGIGLILGVDRLLDMCRTVLNVTGDLAVATCVAHAEKGSAAG